MKDAASQRLSPAGYESLLTCFRATRDLLAALTVDRFPKGSWVRVYRNGDSGLHIVGQVNAHVADNPDLVSVQLENGNCWMYPVETLEHLEPDAPEAKRVAEAIARLRNQAE